ncbi:MAG: hypothetical protein ACSW8J_04045 [bacterium]
MATDNKIMDWDDTIESDGQEFVTLPEGDYTFTITGFERGRYPGSPKIPPCNKAIISASIDNDIGIANTRFDLILYRTLEWKITAFFRCIGQKKHGEKLVMNWNAIIGARGKAHFKPSTYKKEGSDKQYNELERFYDYDESVGFQPVNDDEVPWGNGGF